MKILYIANIRLPTEKAHGIQIIKTCEAFARALHSVELVVPTRKNTITDSTFSYYGVKKIFKITKLRAPDFVRFGRAGFLFSALWFSESARWLKQFWSVDIIYSRDAFVLAQYVLLGRHVVFEAHASPSYISRFVARRATNVVVISNALKEVYISSGVSKEKITVASDAVDAHLFDGVSTRDTEREALGISTDAKIVVYTGHLYARKGVETLSHVAEYLLDTQIFFVGGTDNDIKQFRIRWGSCKNIHIVGHVSHTQIPKYLRAADVLVIPNSATNKDSRDLTSPMKLFEYMASGTPIVASKVPSIQEILSNRDATFFTPDDPVSLAESIKNTLAHAEDSKQKAQNALQKAKMYTWDKRAENILKNISL